MDMVRPEGVYQYQKNVRGLSRLSSASDKYEQSNQRNNDLHWEDILKRLVVNCDGDMALLVNECDGGGSALSGQDGTFTNADLVANKLECNHALGSTSVASVAVIDPNGEIEAVAATLGKADGTDTSNYVTIDFGAPIGAGTFTWIITAV